MEEGILISSKSFDKNSKQLDKLKDYKINSGDIVGIIAGTEDIYINKYPKLKVISRYGVGLDNINLKECKNRGIKVFNTPLAPRESVAELTILLILRLLRKCNDLLQDKVVGIIGIGSIGSRVYELLQGFGCEIVTFDEKIDEWEIYDELLRVSDIITIHTPLNANSFRMVDWCSIECMEKKPYIINTSRKEIIDKEAVEWGLSKNKLRGLASDVNVGFYGFDNVVLTKHIGSDTKQCRKVMEEECINNLIRGLNGLD